MYEKETEIMQQILEKMNERAQLKTVPLIKISKITEAANVAFTKPRITVSERELKKWQNGELDTNDIEALLAHEFGHLIDLKNGVRSVLAKSTIKVVLYFLGGFGLFVAANSISFGIITLFSALLLLIWIVVFPYFTRKWAIAAQLEADRNASKLIGSEQLALSFIRRIRTPPIPMGVIETWQRIRFILVMPTISERLKNLNLELETIQAKFRRVF